MNFYRSKQQGIWSLLSPFHSKLVAAKNLVFSKSKESLHNTGVGCRVMDKSSISTPLSETQQRKSRVAHLASTAFGVMVMIRTIFEQHRRELNPFVLVFTKRKDVQTQKHIEVLALRVPKTAQSFKVIEDTQHCIHHNMDCWRQLGQALLCNKAVFVVHKYLRRSFVC